MFQLTKQDIEQEIKLGSKGIAMLLLSGEKNNNNPRQFGQHFLQPQENFADREAVSQAYQLNNLRIS